MKKIGLVTVIFIASITGFLLGTSAVSAETKSDNQFGVTHSISITQENPVVTLNLDLQEAGKVSTTVHGYFKGANYEIIDADGKTITSRTLLDGTALTPKIEKKSFDLEAGQYTVKFSMSRFINWPSGIEKQDFKFLPEFTPAHNNEQEPNNGTEQAELLALDNKPVRGLISWSDDTDYFKVVLKEAGKLSFEYNSYMEKSTFLLHDEEGTRIQGENLLEGSELTPQKLIDYNYLEPGTYYFKVSKYLDYTGVYTLQASFEAANTDDVEPNNGTEIAQKLQIGKPVKGLISWNDRLDVYQVDVPKDMTLSLSFTAHFSNAHLEVSDESGKQLYKMSPYYESASQPAKESKLIELKKGKHFLAVSKGLWWSKSGIYSLAITEPTVNTGFTDVSAAYKDAVDYLVANKITNGTSSTTFGVDSKIKRVDAAVMLAKALGIEGTSAKPTAFKDVPRRANAAVNALSDGGIMYGKSATSFGANDYLTRGEIALILTRAYQLDGSGTTTHFKDVPKNYQSAVNALVKNKITQGKSPSEFGTKSPITRGEIAIFLYRVSLLD